MIALAQIAPASDITNIRTPTNAAAVRWTGGDSVDGGEKTVHHGSSSLLSHLSECGDTS